MNLDNVRREDWILGGVALLLAIDLLFFPWFSISIFDFSGTDAPDGWLGVLALLATLAVVADRHRVPFHVAAPTSTIDTATPDGSSIPIEERAAEEVLATAPPGATARNFAFDVTPAELVSSIVTEAGVLRSPLGAAIARLREASAVAG